MTDHETLAVYAAKVDDYASMVRVAGRQKCFDALVERLPDGASVLDWGCGVGNTSADLQALGFKVTATDATPEFAAKAKALYGLGVKLESFGALEAKSEFDAIWASFSLLHARKAAMPGHLRQANQALKPSGRLMLGLKLGAGEHRDEFGRFYAYYAEDELLGLLGESGFSVEEVWKGVSIGLDRRDWPWIMILSQKA